jgi:hypothetical protein
MHFNEHQHPFGPERRVNRGLASWLSPSSGTRAGIAAIVLRYLNPPSCAPFAPSQLRDFIATMGALTPVRPGSSGLGP